MYKKQRIVCIIPARGGSKGLPGKNIKRLAGKPLIAYSIEQALESRLIDRVIVSTEDPAIAAVARFRGAEVPFMRPRSLAGDRVGTIDVLVHAINFLERRERYAFDILVLLHATTPLRSVADVDGCIRRLIDSRADNLFSVAEAHKNPYFNMVELDRRGYARLIKKGAFFTRQSAPRVFDMNSSIYVWRKDVLLRKRGVILGRSLVYEMPKERSVDIDGPFDFKIASLLLAKR